MHGLTGRPKSEEHKKHLSEARLGKKHTPETLKKLSEFHKRHPVRYWLGKKMSEEHRKKLSEAQKRIGNKPPSQKGKKLSEEIKRKMGDSRRGKKRPSFSEEWRKNMGKAHRGKKHWNWQGGITKEGARLRGLFEYKLWREAVFKRDNYTCIWCGDNRGGNLEADHIKPFALFPELRLALDNGRTLCKPCHKKTNTYLKGWNTK